MDTYTVDHTTNRTVSIDQDVTASRQMTAEQLLNLGKPRIAYVKARFHEDEVIFVLYAADGVPMLCAESIEMAADAAAELGVEFTSIH